MKVQAFLVKHDDDWGGIMCRAISGDGPGPLDLSQEEIVRWLKSDPSHAVVFPDRMRFILRGASEALENFYWGDLPSEDPNDAEGGDLTAEEVVKSALA